jgi:hypothetical protein
MKYSSRESDIEDAQRMASSEWRWEDIRWNSPMILSEERSTMAMLLTSQSSYAEEAGMVIAAKLCRALEDRDIRRAFAQQASEEARHSELFERYSRIRFGTVAPPSPHADRLLTTLESTEDIYKLFMIHTVFEGVAMDQFSLLQEGYKDDLLGDIYKLVRTDEANHVSMGIKYLKRSLPNVHEDEVFELEQWCTDTLQGLAGMPAVAAFVEKIVPSRDGAKIQHLLESRFENRIHQMFSTTVRKEAS